MGSVGGKQRREVVATFKLDHPYGGWADKSIPHPKHRDEALTSNESEATEQNSVSSPLKTTENTSSDLPPATTSIEASIPPVPLAAIAQPLPEK